MKVCIAEKPSVAKEIAQILGAKTRMDGYYEGNGYRVTWTFGHLCTLKEPNDYTDRWKYWNLQELPMIPSRFGIKIMDDQGVQKQFRTIERLVNDCDGVINCGDAGQEGELIQRWVLLKAKCSVPIERLWISSLTEEAIKEGFSKLKPQEEFENLFKAGSARAIGDWLLGMNATRLFTLKYGQNKQVLSIGRVQTPTLALIVNRQLEIENFQVKDFWELKTTYRDTEFSATIGKLHSEEKAKKAIEYVSNDPFEVTSFEQKEGKEQPPRLYDLTSIQVDANNKFGFTAENTLKLVQGLYEKKIVTYPRVDTTYLPNDMYPKVNGILKGLDYYKRFTESIVDKEIRKSKKVFDDKKITDHHAIVPTGVNPSGISPEENQVFDLIARRFISVFHPDCIVSNTTVMGKVLKVEFKATGKQILDQGWRMVYADQKSSKKSSDEGSSAEKADKIMPHFEKGESGEHQPQIVKKQTSPPKYFTEATLLRGMESAGKQIDDEELREAMKENGIGRPSTRANIIETLFRRKYIEKKRKNIHATITGVQLIEVIENELLKSAELTGQWEKKLREIEQGTYDLAIFQDELKKMVLDLTNEVKYGDSGKTIALVDETKKKSEPKKPREKKELADIETLDCPKCKSHKLKKGKSAYGCANYGGGCKTLIPFVMIGKKLSQKQLVDLIQKGKTTKIKGFLDLNGTKKDGKLAFTDDFNIELIEG